MNETSSQWKGRIDPFPESTRLHQVIQPLSEQKTTSASKQASFSLLRFECDEGVRRNQGRVGAKEGPAAICGALSNLPVHWDPEHQTLWDAGSIIHQDTLSDTKQDPLEATQSALASKVQELLQQGHMPIVLGGGHEIGFGHYQGLHAYLQQAQPHARLGIINFDAHFDLRPKVNGQGSSGSPFLQCGELVGAKNFHYLCLGIQHASNTPSLFQTADDWKVDYVTADQWHRDPAHVQKAIDAFANRCDFLYVTVCLDAFDGSLAPGVSAPSINGMTFSAFFQAFHQILRTQKVLSLDIAEMNPTYDQDFRTAKLAARIVWEVLMQQIFERNS